MFLRTLTTTLLHALLHDWITRHTKKCHDLQHELNTIKAELASTQAELHTTHQQLRAATQGLPDRDRTRFIWFAVALLFLPPLLLSFHHPVGIVGCGMLFALAYLINLSAPYRHEYGSNSHDNARYLASRMPKWQWALAVIAGVFFAFGAVSNHPTLTAISLSGSLMFNVLPAILYRPRP